MSCPTWSRTSCSWMAVMVFSSGGGLGWVVGRGAVVRVGAGGSARRGDAGRGTTGGWGATVGVGRLREQRVAGLVDGGGDVGLVDGLVGGDGDGAGLDVDGDGLYAGDGADRGGDGVAAVVAGHALDPEGLGPDERRGGVSSHAVLLGSVVRAFVLSVLVMAGRSSPAESPGCWCAWRYDGGGLFGRDVLRVAGTAVRALSAAGGRRTAGSSGLRVRGAVTASR